jgi:hypothetical protein
MSYLAWTVVWFVVLNLGGLGVGIAIRKGRRHSRPVRR